MAIQRTRPYYFGRPTTAIPAPYARAGKLTGFRFTRETSVHHKTGAVAHSLWRVQSKTPSFVPQAHEIEAASIPHKPNISVRLFAEEFVPTRENKAVVSAMMMAGENEPVGSAAVKSTSLMDLPVDQIEIDDDGNVQERPTALDHEFMYHILHPSPDAQTETIREFKYARSRMKLAYEERAYWNKSLRETISIKYYFSVETRQLVKAEVIKPNKEPHVVTGKKNIDDVLKAYGISHLHEISQKRYYEVSPYLTYSYRDAYQVIVWDKLKQTIQLDVPDVEQEEFTSVSLNRVNSEEDLFLLVGHELRRYERLLLQDAITKKGTEYVILDLDQFVQQKKMKEGWEIPTEDPSLNMGIAGVGNEGTAYLTTEERPSIIKTFSKSQHGEPGDIYRDQIKALFRMQRALERSGEKRIRVVDIYAIGLRFIYREKVNIENRKLNHDALLEIANDLAKKDSLELKAIARMIEDSLKDKVKDPGRNIGLSYKQDEDDIFVIYDPR